MRRRAHGLRRRQPSIPSSPMSPSLADPSIAFLVSPRSLWTAFPPLPRSGACSRYRPLSAVVQPHRRTTPATIWKRHRCLLVRHGRVRPTRVPPRPRELPAARSVLDLGAPAMDGQPPSFLFFFWNYFLKLINSWQVGPFVRFLIIFRNVSVINKTLIVGPSCQIFNIF
jgi:hypothetical protein